MTEQQHDPQHEATLRDILTAEAADVRPTGDWADVNRRRRSLDARARSKRALGAVVAVAAAVAIAVPLLRSDDLVDIDTNPANPTTSAPGPTSSTPDSSSSTTIAPSPIVAGPVVFPAGEALEPGAAVVVVNRPGEHEIPIQDLAVIDIESGEMLRQIDSTDTSEGGFLSLTLTPDRRTLLYSVSTSACGAQTWATAVDGSGTDQRLGEGERAAISPDGATLAMSSDDNCNGVGTITIQPVAGGPVDVYGDGGSALAGAEAVDPEYIERVVGLAFFDDQTLAYDIQFEDGTALHRLDIGSGTSARIDTSGGPAFTYAAPRNGETGTVVVLETCCDPVQPESVRVLAIDAAGAIVASPFARDLTGDTIAAMPPTGGDDRLAWLTRDNQLHASTPSSSTPVIGRTDVVHFVW